MSEHLPFCLHSEECNCFWALDPEIDTRICVVSRSGYMTLLCHQWILMVLCNTWVTCYGCPREIVFAGHGISHEFNFQLINVFFLLDDLVQIQACHGILLSLSLLTQQSKQIQFSQLLGLFSCWHQLCLVLWFKWAVLLWRRRHGWDRWVRCYFQVCDRVCHSFMYNPLWILKQSIFLSLWWAYRRKNVKDHEMWMFNVLQMMTTMGLMDSAYWLTWLLWEVVLVFVSSLLLVCFGLLFQFDFFLHNNFGVLFFIFFLFSLNMVNSQPQWYNKIITMRVCIAMCYSQCCVLKQQKYVLHLMSSYLMLIKSLLLLCIFSRFIEQMHMLLHLMTSCFQFWSLQTGFAFMISNFISVATSATSVSYYIFIIGFILQVDFPFFSAISFTSLYNVEEPRFVYFIRSYDARLWLLATLILGW